MTRPLVGLGGAIALVALTAAPVAGAVQRATVSPSVAAPGTSVTLEIEITVKLPGADPTKLVMIPAASMSSVPEAAHCDEIAGAVEVATIGWRASPVTFGDATYDGFAGTATFAVPLVPDGEYVLAQNIDATRTGCHPYAKLTVSASSLPDTAMPVAVRLQGGIPINRASVDRYL